MNHYNGFTPYQRQKSWDFLKPLYESGEVARPTKCEVCGQEHGRIEHHAEDYSEPFGPHIYEFELCYTCHMMIHCRFRNRDRWDQYRALVSAGYRFAAVPTSKTGWPSWPAFRERYLNRALMQVQHEIHDPRGTTLLDLIDAEERDKKAV